MQEQIEAALREAKEQQDGPPDPESQDSQEPKGGKKKRQPGAVEILLEIASGEDLFHDASYDCFIGVVVDDHRETMRINSPAFRRFLLHKFYDATGGRAPSREALKTAICTLEAQASFCGGQRPVAVRVAGDDDALFLDLGDDAWTVVEVTRAGWRLRRDAPVALHRPPGLKPLPMPSREGDIGRLRHLLNTDAEGFTLMVAWLVGALCHRGPYPVLCLGGEQGCAKSTVSRTLRSLVDPNTAPLRTIPKNEHDLVVSATNSWVFALDNLSRTESWLSDAICRLSTGGGFSTRTLYEDRSEQLFDVRRPAIVNGISDIVSRHDLADRCLFVTLRPIPDSDRRAETDLERDLAEAAPAILGGLLDAAVVALRNFQTTRPDGLPRMADFYRWVLAAEPALPWPKGQFEAFYQVNRGGAVEAAVTSSPLGAAVLQFAQKTTAGWIGTASELHAELERLVDVRTLKAKAWPKSPAAMSRSLRTVSSFLRRMGIDIDLDIRDQGGRKIRITRTQ